MAVILLLLSLSKVFFLAALERVTGQGLRLARRPEKSRQYSANCAVFSWVDWITSLLLLRKEDRFIKDLNVANGIYM